MTRWEYLTTPIPESRAQELLNGFGVNGWELVICRNDYRKADVIFYQCVFKRPLNDAERE